MKRKAFTLIELLVVIAIIAILAAILFPVFAQAKKAAKKAASAQNNRQMALAGLMYAGDYDDTICVMINGPYRDLKNNQDGQLTTYGEQRTDGWPLLVIPYIKSRGLFVDPGRGDVNGIWAGPALATLDPGFNPNKNTFRNQSRYTMYGINYLFASPLLIPASKMSDATPTDWMQGEAHTTTEADDPSGTVFFTESQRGYNGTNPTDHIGQLDSTRGFFGVNAPGIFEAMAPSSVPYVIFYNQNMNCSGDWCGDCDLATAGNQKRTSYCYIGYNDGANATFIDGHVKYMKDAGLASGTNYLTATPSITGGYGGCHIIDKVHYLWNLNDNYFNA